MPSGVFSDSGLSLVFSSSSLTFSASVMKTGKLWTNDVTPESGMDHTDLGLISGSLAVANIVGSWIASVLVTAGVRYREASNPWPFDFSPLFPETTVYGFAIVNGVTSETLIYYERFVNGPYVLTKDSIFSIKPRIYLRNWDVAVP